MTDAISIVDMNLIDLDWPGFKDFVDGTTKSLLGQYVDSVESYFIFCVDSTLLYAAFIYKDGQEPIGWTPQQISDNTTYRTDFENNFQANFNKQIS